MRISSAHGDRALACTERLGVVLWIRAILLMGAAVRAEIEVLRRERLAYEQESIQTRQDLARSEAHCRALEARVTVLETEVRRHEWQRQAADDLAVQHIMRTQALEAGARIDTLEDTGVSAALAARDATRNGTDSHSSGMGVRGSERVAREMETIFRISNCSVENQIKFSTCTLLAGALTWWNSHVMTVTHDVAYSMTWVDLKKKMTDKYMFPYDQVNNSKLQNQRQCKRPLEKATELMDKESVRMAE
ncbi:hypothetical protein Tco_0976038 [Tanacetum coccineum]|uniref:Reverse transcriptase domain-containing protein n=1 Tax=Tanacetum coccineum TaxID=301880 RepID=A0ABQ5EG42_9ASTR